ncbi:MAG TPA: 2,3-bisphosphoglycerate-independent phosphoglycerate mutase, partial [Gemmatimonadales bacterium]
MSNRSAPGVVLVVLDGWGYRQERDGNAIELASTPTWHRLWRSSPRALLDASGLAVGLPPGQMGNSEVGHLNLGAGRVVPQDLVRISQSIQSGDFYSLEPLVQLCAGLRQTGGTLHLVGLLGPGGVHALDRHLLACVELGIRHKVQSIAIHGFLDGRDSAPTLGAEVMRTLLVDMRRIAGSKVDIASLTGRYYGMDRDRRWERTRLAYEAMVHGQGTPVEHPVMAVQAAYQRGETDEFIKPLVHVRKGVPVATLREGDGVFFFNYRSDRMRQIVAALTSPGFDAFDVRNRPHVAAVTMTQYDQTFAIPQAFPPFSLARILAEVLADQGRTQFRTAETEKYPHVTYFFNGGYEPPYGGEERCLVPSQRVATYDLAPEMSAAGVTDVLCRAIEARSHDFLLCNYANADMVGHTGVLPAVIKAVETVDQCLTRVLTSAEKAGSSVIITADHGNCEMM